MKANIKVIVIDDEPYSRDELHYLLKQYEDIDIIGEADSGEKGLEIIMRKEPDVVFVDIEMPQMSGLEMAKALQNMKRPPLIIFATAYTNYAVNAFRVQALDYLVKPFDEMQISEVIERIRSRIKATKQKDAPVGTGKLAVEENGRIIYLSPETITYIFREERESVICTVEKKYSLKMPIKDLEEKLRGYPFFRIHKSYLVNLNKVEELIPWFNGAFQLKIVGQMEEIPVSRNYVKALRERLEL